MRSLTVPLLIFLCSCGRAPESGLELVGDGALDFGTIAMGTTKTLSVELRNTGTTPVQLSSIQSTNDVFVPNDALISIPPGRTNTVEVTFKPPLELDTASRDYLGELSLQAGNVILIRSVKGRAERASCAFATSLDFGAVQINDTAMQRIPLNGLTPLLVGVTGAAFTAQLVDDALEVRFIPTAAGDQTGKVTLNLGPQCGRDNEVALTGTGVAALLDCQPYPLDFGYTPPSLTRNATVRLQNFSLAPVMLTDLQTRVGTTPSTEFRFTGPTTSLTLPSATRQNGTLTPGQLEVSLSFTPVLLGLRTAALTATTALTAQPILSCPLRGTGGGPDIDIQPRILDLGTVPVFAGSAVTRKVTITNLGTSPTPPDPTANLHLARWTVVPKNSISKLDDICVGAFDTATNTCLNLPPAGYDPVVGIRAALGASLDIPIRVMPSVIGDLEWDVTFESDDPDEASVTVNVRAHALVLPDCTYTVSAPSMDFGLLPVSGTRTLGLILRNTGADSCLITWLDVAPGSSAAFTLPAGPVNNLALLPGASQTIDVRVTAPTTAAALTSLTGSLTISSSSRSSPQRSVPLTAQVGTGCLAMLPGAISFGTTKETCSSVTRQVRIYNGCLTGVTVLSFGVSGATAPPGTASCPGTAACPEVLVDGAPSFAAGTVLAPVSSPATIALKYHPLDLGDDRGVFRLQVVENGNMVSYVVPLSGTGAAVGQHTDSWLSETAKKSDLLFVIDNSSGMADEQTGLAQAYASVDQFARYASSAGFDFRIAVTTTDLTTSTVGAFVSTPSNPAVISSASANPGTLFAQKVAVGTTGSSTRGVAEAALRALLPPLTQGVNRGFLRDDATLAIIGVTDGPDRSPAQAGYYEAAFIELKNADRSAVSFNVVGPVWPAMMGCAALDDPWPSASKLRSLSLAFEGRHEPNSSPPWSQVLESMLARGFAARSQYSLSGEPDLSGGNVITVKLDHHDGSGPQVVSPVDPRGAPVWSYDAVARAVIFQPLFAPAPGDTVTATYPVVCH